MIIVDGIEIKVSKVREETLKVIIDAIEKGYLTDTQINGIQLNCLYGALEHEQRRRNESI